MAENILRNLKAFGLTPWQLILGLCLGYGWMTSLMPMPAEMRQLNETVARLGTKVEIHSVLIAQITDLSNEVKGMRRELSTIEGRLAHVSNYRKGSEP
jgi:aryl-alcohol dehydrogenase-like predicted oxidoreductase